MFLIVLAATLIVVSVHDGDTLSVRDQTGGVITLRLAQIDAPERGQPYWRVARRALSDLCINHAVAFTPVDVDRYGRTAAQLECGGAGVNFELVRLGLAWCFRRYVTDDRCYGIEAEARRERRGLWSESDPMSPWDWRARRRDPQGE